MSDKILKQSRSGAAAPCSASAKIVKGDVFEASLLARQIVEAAHAQARELVTDAELAREKLIEAARVEGYEQGLKNWNTAVAAVDAARDQYLMDSETELVRLAVRIAQKIITHELQTNPEVIVSIARECLRGLQRERSLKLRATPADAELLRLSIQRLREIAGDERTIELVADPSVGPGGCIVESEYGTIDAGLDTQIRCMEEILLRAARK